MPGRLAFWQLVLTIAPTLWIAAGARVGAAAVHVVVWAVAPLVAAELAQGENEGRASGLVFLGGSLAMLTGIPAMTALGQWAGWRVASACVAVAAALLALALWRVLPPMPPPEAADVADAQPTRASSGRQGAPIAVTTATVVAAFHLVYPYLSQWSSAAGISEKAYAAVLLVYGTAGLAGVWTATRSIDAHPLATSTVIIGLTSLSVAVVHVQGWLFIATLVVWGAAIAAVPVVLQTSVIRVAGPRGDVLSSVYVIAYQVGIAVGTALGAHVLPAAGWWVAPMVLAALLGLPLAIGTPDRRLSPAGAAPQPSPDLRR
ncbi:MFS transporter [Dermacoccaceae bacterium W4C1]